jgi:hypothetical protein
MADPPVEKSFEGAPAPDVKKPAAPKTMSLWDSFMLILRPPDKKR